MGMRFPAIPIFCPLSLLARYHHVLLLKHC